MFKNMDTTLDASAFLSGSFDYASFDASLGAGTGLTPLPTSASPPSQHLSLLPNGSGENGLGFDPDDGPQAEEVAAKRRIA